MGGSEVGRGGTDMGAIRGLERGGCQEGIGRGGRGVCKTVARRHTCSSVVVSIGPIGPETFCRAAPRLEAGAEVGTPNACWKDGPDPGALNFPAMHPESCARSIVCYSGLAFNSGNSTWGAGCDGRSVRKGRSGKVRLRPGQ